MFDLPHSEISNQKSTIRNPMNACLEFAAVEANPEDYHAEKAAHS